MNKDQEELFREWWDSVGSGMIPLPHEDREEHARRVAYRAYCACLDHNELET